MNRLLGVLDLLFGALFGVLALLALSYLPDAYERRTVEPEDLYLCLFWFGFSVVVGAAAATVGWMLLRQRAFWRISLGKAAFLSALIAVLTLLLSAIGFLPHDPASVEMRLFLLPTALFGVSFFVLLRLGRAKASRDRQTRQAGLPG